MSALTAPRCSTLLFAVVVVFVSADPKIIIAKSGQDITLKCRAPNDKTRAVEWKRTDLLPEYVLLYQDDHLDPKHQHPSFNNRVDLQDRQMTDGDVSLIVKDVTINDAGTYKCHVFMNQTQSWEPISIIKLLVLPPDPEIITAESGQDVTLTCRAPNSKVLAVQWSRGDLGDEYVLVYQDGHFDPANQHPSFKNRVDLQDRQMKDGDVSLILKDVTTADDTGAYKCHVLTAETDSFELITSTFLIVDPGHTGGYLEWVAALLFLLIILSGILLLLLLPVFLIYKMYTKIQKLRTAGSGGSVKYSQLRQPTRRKRDDNLQSPV